MVHSKLSLQIVKVWLTDQSLLQVTAGGSFFLNATRLAPWLTSGICFESRDMVLLLVCLESIWMDHSSWKLRIAVLDSIWTVDSIPFLCFIQLKTQVCNDDSLYLKVTNRFLWFTHLVLLHVHSYGSLPHWDSNLEVWLNQTQCNKSYLLLHF